MIFKPVAVSDVRGVDPPTAPVKVTVPPVPPINVKFCAPLIVLEALILAPVVVPPALVVSTTTPPVSVTAPAQLTAPPAVVWLFAKLITPV